LADVLGQSSFFVRRDQIGLMSEPLRQRRAIVEESELAAFCH
jgi:hypothetical protein